MALRAAMEDVTNAPRDLVTHGVIRIDQVGVQIATGVVDVALASVASTATATITNC